LKAECGSGTETVKRLHFSRVVVCDRVGGVAFGCCRD
jgi:hypothetical protein